MASRELRLVDDRTRSTPAGRAGALVLAGIVLGAAAVATGAGADRHRVPIDAQLLAQGAIELSVSEGVDAPEVRATLRRLRRELGRRPLDARLRVVYAGLVLGLSSRPADAELAAAHAARSLELAPVTVPVVRSAVLVLAHAGRPGAAAEPIREMFGYDARRAADLLAQVEPMLTPEMIERAVPPFPGAAIAWATRLRRDLRHDEADAVLAGALERWPEDLLLRERLVARAVSNGAWDLARRLVAREPDLPETPEAAPLLVHRARVHVHEGRLAEARTDLATALELDGGSRRLRILAGDVAASMDDLETAREQWSRALHRTGVGEGDLLAALRIRLARLEEDAGRPGTALRHWRAVLRLRPDDLEARRRVAALGGPGSRP